MWKRCYCCYLWFFFFRSKRFWCVAELFFWRRKVKYLSLCVASAIDERKFAFCIAITIIVIVIFIFIEPTSASCVFLRLKERIDFHSVDKKKFKMWERFTLRKWPCCCCYVAQCLCLLTTTTICVLFVERQFVYLSALSFRWNRLAKCVCKVGLQRQYLFFSGSSSIFSGRKKLLSSLVVLCFTSGFSGQQTN